MNYADVFKLNCGIQHYSWGGRLRDGHSPFIADLLGIDPGVGEPFAELWIGAHPKLPADVMTEGGCVPIDRFIADGPREILGIALLQSGYRSLPFLLKVLDCEQPLSIQAHPDLARASVLHERDPDHYPDNNHKPEIAVGITGMSAFCQFRPADDIEDDIRRIPPLASFLGDAAADSRPRSRQWLRQLYSRLFEAGDSEVEATLESIWHYIRQRGANCQADEWFLKLSDFYPGDRGILSAFFLNIVRLAPWEGAFLGPNEPHAYLRGTIIECMANSDNVVRAGLTQKFIDREVLVDMLTYRQGKPPVDNGEQLRPGELVYRVPAPEFQVEVYVHGKGYSGIYASGGAVSAFIVLDGSAVLRTSQSCRQAGRGSIWLWPAGLDEMVIEFLAPGTRLVRARPNMQVLGQ